MKSKKIILNKKRDVSLSYYIVTNEIKPTFLICPGGSYQTCNEGEGNPIYGILNEKGFNVFVLCYSVGEHYKWSYPIDDYNSAIEYMCEHKDELSVDMEHIIVIGLSAGGHVASCAASIATKRPYAVVLCYPLIKRELLDFCAPDAPDSSTLVNMNTCPCFIVASRNDWIVSIDNTTSFIEALRTHYIDYETHIYGYALHGFSVGKPAMAEGELFCTRINDWFDEFLSWLDDLLSGRYVSVREGADYNDIYSKTLSTKNSCQLIYGNKAAADMLKKKFPVQNLIIETARKNAGSFSENVSMRNIYELMNVFRMPSASEKTIKKIDNALSAFVNERCVSE